MSTKIEHIHIDPSELPGFLEDFKPDEVQADEWSLSHDPDWVDKICESIRIHRLALIKMPPRYAAFYQKMLQPETFPSEVKDMEVSGQVKKSGVMLNKDDVLPSQLQDVVRSWSTVCQHLTKHVAQRLRRKVLQRPLEPPAHHESHGQVRVAINCDTEPHNDNSYVTMLGTGNMRGTLKLEVEGHEEWPACEDFIEEVTVSKTEGPTFIMFGGSKLLQIDGEEYRPLNHVVEFNLNRIADSERINVTYFVRRYDEGYPDATNDITSTEVQFQHYNRIILQQELYHRPPRPPPVATAKKAQQLPEISPEEEFLENGCMDWSSDGITVTCENAGQPTALDKSVWTRAISGWFWRLCAPLVVAIAFRVVSPRLAVLAGDTSSKRR